ncbi:MAG: hypothetical protein LBF57_02010 [Holosporaceae bacterium]|jgi:hypothetical protein|nr:hypothetical protein [Holosporaceae bacterium]
MGGFLGRFNRHSGYGDASSSIDRLFVEQDLFSVPDVISRGNPSDIGVEGTDEASFQKIELTPEEQSKIIQMGQAALEKINSDTDKKAIAQELFNKVKFGYGNSISDNCKLWPYWQFISDVNTILDLDAGKKLLRDASTKIGSSLIKKRVIAIWFDRKDKSGTPLSQGYSNDSNILSLSYDPRYYGKMNGESQARFYEVVPVITGWIKRNDERLATVEQRHRPAWVGVAHEFYHATDDKLHDNNLRNAGSKKDESRQQGIVVSGRKDLLQGHDDPLEERAVFDYVGPSELSLSLEAGIKPRYVYQIASKLIEPEGTILRRAIRTASVSNPQFRYTLAQKLREQFRGRYDLSYSPLTLQDLRRITTPEITKFRVLNEGNIFMPELRGTQEDVSALKAALIKIKEKINREKNRYNFYNKAKTEGLNDDIWRFLPDMRTKESGLQSIESRITATDESSMRKKLRKLMAQSQARIKQLEEYKKEIKVDSLRENLLAIINPTTFADPFILPD